MTQHRPLLALVLGVHRSGTSLLTAGLQALGCGLGGFADTQDIDNPTGYFEHPEVRDFNDRVLRALGATWDNWGFHAPSQDWDIPALAPLRAEAGAMIARLFPGPGPYALKDPRIATLLPFWERVLADAGVDLRRILIVRRPDEVAESQRQRAARRPDLFDAIGGGDAMAALWAVTMHGVLATLPDDRTLLVMQDALYADLSGTLAACALHLGLPVDPRRTATFAARLPDARLRRAAGAPPVPGPWGDIARDLWGALGQGPSRLTRFRARTIAAGQRRLIAELPGLAAVRDSLSRLADRRAQDAATLAALRRAVWAMGGAAGALPADAAGALVGALDRIGAPAAETPLASLTAQLAYRAEGAAAAEARLRALQAAAPDDPTAWALLLGHLRATGGAEAATLAERAHRRFPHRAEFRPNPTDSVSAADVSANDASRSRVA
ncbi:MAG TPA: hypothetical protein VLA78_11810 [Paracoccaceae bacterium]|nr:hypothetical protein [Paracoccaceae bacterium]